MLRFSSVVFLAVVMVLLGWFLMSKPAPTSAQPENRLAPVQREQFAQDRAPKEVTPAAFDAQRALGYLKDICNIGPRISGSEGMNQQQELIKKHFEAQGGKVEFQRFKARQLSQKQPVDMANIIVSWYPDRPRRVIICSHYDTRPIADQEADRRKWKEPFVSANDGGSGVAFLMEMAHHMKDLKTEVGVDFVLFDGEEYIFEREDKYFLGSQNFGMTYRKSRPKFAYIGAILLDMIGGKGAKFPKEPNSLLAAGPLVESVWKTAAELKCAAFVQQQGNTAVEDDHTALNRNGIPAIDVIDFDYAHWHKLSDTPDKCAPESLEQVAKVLSVWVQRVK